MKRTTILLAALLFTQLSKAGEVVLVIKDKSINTTTRSEVKIEDSSHEETITITPNHETTHITLTLKDENGSTIFQNFFPTNTSGTYFIPVPDTNTGNSLEISDNQGIICTYCGNNM